MTPRAVDAAAWAALDRVPDGVAIFAIDWTVLYVNPAGAAVLDRTVDGLVGTGMWESFPEAVGTEFHTNLLAAASAEPGAEPVRWSAYYGPVHGWFSDLAWRVGDHVVVVYARSDEPRAAEDTRQRLTGEIRTALARSQVLLAASEAFLAATTLAEIGEAVAALLVEDGDPPVYVDLALLEPGGSHLQRIRSHTGAEDLREADRRIPLDADQPAAECARSGQSVFVPDLSTGDARYLHLSDPRSASDRQATACVPLPGPAGPQGVLVFVWTGPRELDVGEQALVTTLGVYAGQAIARLRIEEERVAAAQTRFEDTRATMLAMQRMLLAELPVLPGVRIAAHYVPAEEDTAAGGDWFDAIPLDRGRVALVVGDVVGHGSVAAATMGQLRAVTGQLLADGANLKEVSAGLDRFAVRVRAARGATVCLAVLDSDTGELEWITRGHPPPLLVEAHDAWFLTGEPSTAARAAGGDDVLGAAGGGLLGLDAAPATVWSSSVPTGATLLFYTDGLVESPERDLDEGLHELRHAALASDDDSAGRRAAPEATPLGARVLAHLGARGFGDDVTVLVVQRTVALDPLRVVVDAEPRALGRVRRAVDAWLEPLDLDPDDVDNLVLAVSEAVSNAVEHAYPQESATDAEPAVDARPVTIDAALGPDGVLAVTVTDRGRWRRPSVQPDNRGRGLQLMQMLVESVVVERDQPVSGTCVRLTQRLTRPAVFGTAARPAASGERAEFSVRIERGERAAVRARGSVDMLSAPELHRGLLDAGRGGAVPVMLDLTEVDQLASAGVTLLHDLRTQLTLRVRVRAGTAAAQVLALTGLDDLVITPAAATFDDALACDG